jgi:predicted ArsR family transcriptional regulator
MSRRKTKKTANKSVPVHAGTGAAHDARTSILAFLKHHHGGEVAHVATHLGISYEGARQHLKQLEIEGMVEKRLVRPAHAVAGRPLARYLLTPSGDHLFPKSYDELAVELIDTVADRLGKPALKQVLGALTDKRVREWAPRLQGKPLAERVAALQAVYRDGDPYMSVEIGRNGMRLIERNCPFLNVASRRPALCSVTVSTLERLLGVKVVREERFQSGHGRCVFRVLNDEPVDTRRFRFALEGETPDSPAA